MKKLSRRFLSTLLVFMMLFSLTSISYAASTEDIAPIPIPASSAGGTVNPMSGPETLPLGSGIIGDFTLTGTNLTPVKTMGASGKLRIFGSAEVSSSNNNWYVVIQLKDYNTGKIIAETTSYGKGNDLQTYAVSTSVTKGQKLRIYMYYGVVPTNKAHISISYGLSNS